MSKERDTLIGVSEVCRLMGISRSTLERLINPPDGSPSTFPRPVQGKKGGHRKWKRSVIEALMEPRKRPSELSKMTPEEREEYDLQMLWRGVQVKAWRGEDATPRELMSPSQRRKDDVRWEAEVKANKALWDERMKLPTWQELSKRSENVRSAMENPMREWPALPSSRAKFLEQWRKGRRE